METKCGCWAFLKRGVRGSCKSSASNHSANTIPRTSLVYDAGSSFFFFSFFFSLFTCFSVTVLQVLNVYASFLKLILVCVCVVYGYFTFCDVNNLSSLLSHSLTFF